ncbi:MAG TPA: alpha-1,2-fucosyltransferase [Candidatus Wunengus sp. YC60]|uniref:alpha-1,2-fucosyltransferase n=1 Tax=Candidatus Wunengus sp. YC60 TaxID=3367697 RepID=UPI0040283AF3
MSFLIMDTFGMKGGPRLGNQLFQYASAYGLAKKYNKELRLPSWKYSPAFDSEFPLETFRDTGFGHVQEPGFHYSLVLPGGNVNIDRSYLQSEKYFEDCKDDIKALFKFKKQFVIDCLSQFPQAFEKKTIAIHIRRSDYINNRNYLNLSIPYYICTLQDNFPDWKNMNLIFFSDDIKYVKAHFGCLSNAFFSEHNTDIEDMCLMSQCDHFILSNSTFAWWSTWLGEKPGSIIVRPTEYFRGKLKERCDDKDLWPERWRKSHVDKRISLNDTTFMIPVTYDHQDRKENFSLTMKFIENNFMTNVIVAEEGGQTFLNGLNPSMCKYYPHDMKYFHRTKMLNNIARRSETPIIFNWDADIIMSPVQVWQAIEKIREGADMVYPYDGRFAKVPRLWFKIISPDLDVSRFAGIAFNGLQEGRRASVGGAVAFNKESFFKGGGENENYISYGPEDRERFYRFTTLGFRIERVKGVLYHMNHFKGKNSLPIHENHTKNVAEHRKILSLGKNDLQNYVNSWPWK